MKTILKVVICALVMLFVANRVSAQLTVTADANAHANIIAPLTIAWDADMNFGNLALIGGAPGTAVLTPEQNTVRTSTGGVTLVATLAGVVKAAAFEVNAEGGRSLQLLLPATACTVVRSGGTETMDVDTWTSSVGSPWSVQDPIFTMDPSGFQYIYVGGTLHVDGAQTPGLYDSQTPFTVTLSYQ